MFVLIPILLASVTAPEPARLQAPALLVPGVCRALGGDAPRAVTNEVNPILVSFDDSGFLSVGERASFASEACRDSNKDPAKDTVFVPGLMFESRAPAGATVQVGPVPASTFVQGWTVVECWSNRASQCLEKLFLPRPPTAEQGRLPFRPPVGVGEALGGPSRVEFHIAFRLLPTGPPAATATIAVIGPEVQQTDEREIRSAELPNGGERFSVPVDDLGVGSWRFLNRRNPPWVRTDPNDELSFVNRSAGRTIQVTVTGATLPAGGAGYLQPQSVVGQQDDAVRREPCEKEPCRVLITLHAGEEVIVPARWFAPPPTGNVAPLEFTVSFFGEQDKPESPTGYLATVPLSRLEEPASAARFSLVGSVSYQEDPVLPDLLTEADPASDERLSHWPALARLTLNANLGARASAVVDFQLKAGDLGGDDTVKDVRVTRYRIDNRGLWDTALSFGRCLVAAPSNSIALRENGEAVVLSVGHVSLGHVLRRESEAGRADVDDDDSSSWVLQARSLRGPGGSVLQSVDLAIAYGKDEKPGDEFWYGTAGGQLNFLAVDPLLTGSIAIYHSRKEASSGSDVAAGRGWVWLGTAAWTSRFDSAREKGARATFGVTIGGSSADDLETPTDEGFVGQTAAFQPDQLFLSQVVKRLPDVGPGLNNKTYVGLSATLDWFSPIELIAAIFRTPESDINTRATVIRLHQYRAASGPERDLGREIDVEFQLESPRGVAMKVIYSRYFPGRLVDSLFPKSDPWGLSAQAVVTIR